MNNKQIFEGVFTALITPFNKDGSIDIGALKALVEWQIINGVQGLVPAGTTGESPTISHSEHFQVIKAVVEQTNNRVPVIAGTGSNSTQEAIDLTKEAYNIGVSATLQVTPYYNKPSQEGLYQHFITIAEHTNLPQILYNIPGRTSKEILLDTMIRLISHPLVVGIKEATGHIITTIDLVQEQQEISILSGDDNLVLAIIAQGGNGVISVASNIIPQDMVRLVSLALQDNISEARTLYYNILPLLKSLFIDTNPIPVKYAASTLGICQEYYRLPLCQLHTTDKTHIDTVLSQYPIHYP